LGVWCNPMLHFTTLGVTQCCSLQDWVKLLALFYAMSGSFGVKLKNFIQNIMGHTKKPFKVHKKGHLLHKYRS